MSRRLALRTMSAGAAAAAMLALSAAPAAAEDPAPAGLLSTTTTTVTDTTEPVLSTTLLPDSIFASCIILDEQGNFRAVFGYENTHDSVITVNVSTNVDDALNTLAPVRLNGQQVSEFKPGVHGSAFVTGTLAPSEVAEWRVGGLTGLYAKASSSTKVCETGPSLPGEGNGLGGALVGLVSLPLAAAAWFASARRRRSA